MTKRIRGRTMIDVNDVPIVIRDRRNEGRLIAYYRGYLPSDRNPDVFLIKQKMLDLSNNGSVYLVQRRHDDFDYTYYFVPAERKTIVTHAPPIGGMFERRGRHNLVWRRFD